LATIPFNLSDEQETHYFDCAEDIRIQKNKYFSKIWMKKGKLHDDAREEIEVQCKKDDFEKLQKIFNSQSAKMSYCMQLLYPCAI